MTPKENLLNAIQFKETSRLPVAVIDGYLWMIRKNNLSFKDLFEMDIHKATDLIQKTYEELGSDIVYGNAVACTALNEVMGGAVDFSATGNVVTITKNALTELSEIKNFTVNDVFAKLIAHPYYETMVRQLELFASRIGDEKLLMAFCGGPMTIAASMCGVQKLMMTLYEDEDIVNEVLGFMTEMTIKILEHQIKHGANAIFLPEPLASTKMISKEFFEKFALPNIKKITSALKKYNIPVVLHICGENTPQLEPLKEAGIDVFSVDSVDFKSALAVVKGNYAIFGNLSPVNVLQNKSESEVYELASELAKIAGLEGGFIMAPGCDLAADTPLENVHAMVKAAYNFK